MAKEDSLDFPLESPLSSFAMPTSRAELIKVGLLGAGVGLLVALLGFLIERFFITPVFCTSPDSFGVCASGGLTAYYVATVLATIAAVVTMAQWQIFRPLLIAVAAAAALWGLKKYSGELAVQSGWEFYIYSAGLFAAAYLLFYWVMRLKAFWLSVALAVVLVVVIRFALIA